MLIEAIVVLQVVNLTGFGLMFWFARSDAQARLRLMEILRDEIRDRDRSWAALHKSLDPKGYVQAQQ